MSEVTRTETDIDVDLTNAVKELDAEVQATNENRVRTSTSNTYASHVNGKYGFETFIQKYNYVTGSSYSFNPPSKNLHVLLKRYFELLAKKGNKNNLSIKICQKNTPIDAKTVYVAYSALLI